MKNNLRKFIAVLPLLGMTYVLSAQKEDFQLTKNIEIFFSAFRELQNLYVDSLGYDNMMTSAISGMTDKLDPYTEYVPEEEQEDFDFQTTGRYGGIGALIQQDSNYVRVVSPYKGFPADVAGLNPGDRLIEIDSNDLSGLSVDKVSNMLRGPLDTKVEVKAIKLRGGDTVNLVLQRRTIRMPGVPYYGMSGDGTGYIFLASFTAGCADEFKDALSNLQKTGRLKSLIIDLRNNGGGRPIEAVKILNLFIPSGIEVVKAKGRVKEYDLSYSTSEKPVEPDLPIAVLVNGGTASASEIVAGVIQDLDRGVVIGSRTYGKGLIQTVRQLGYNAQVKITTAKYYIPSGRCVQAHNFSVRNQDGSVAFIPDSLKKEFKTKNGRKVFDGGGITPDLISIRDEYPPIAIGIENRNLFLEYSLQYYKKHLTVDTPDKFSLTDAEYDDFTDFLSSEKYNYETASERAMRQLTAAVKREKYYDEVGDELEKLTAKLKHDETKDLKIHKAEIKRILEAEIAGKYYYEAGHTQSALRFDKQVLKAEEILNDMTKYNNLLDPTSVVAASK